MLARMYIVIVVIIGIIAILILCYSIVSHATLGSFSSTHVNTIELLNITCTLVATKCDTTELKVQSIACICHSPQ